MLKHLCLLVRSLRPGIQRNAHVRQWIAESSNTKLNTRYPVLNVCYSFSSAARPCAITLSSSIYTSPFIFNSSKKSWLPTKTRALKPLPLEALRIITWNIYFPGHYPELRMQVLLTHLESLLSKEPLPTIILFQEVHPSALVFFLAHTWVRRNFAITDIILSCHSPRYGTVTLIARKLVPSVSCFRVLYQNSRMSRDALFVDLKVVLPRSVGAKGRSRSGTFRVGNTHLESLEGHGTVVRPMQLATVRDILGMPGVHAGIVGGDMNAITPEDQNVPQKIGMRDLWAGEEGDLGATWGYQPRGRYIPKRVDKILVVGGVGLVEDSSVEFVGVGLKTESDRENGIDRRYFVSDHYGLMGVVRLVSV